MRDADSERPPPAGKVAVIAVHGVADQRPGQTVRELARLLCHGGQPAPRYVQGQTHGVLIATPPLQTDGHETVRRQPAQPTAPRPGSSSRFHQAMTGAGHSKDARQDDLGLAYTDHLLARYEPGPRDTLYESTMISLTRRGEGDAAGRAVDLYELYWADFSRLRPGGIRALSALYQLFFHLTTLARDVVDHAALATGHAPGFPLLQRLMAWTTWLLKLPAALIQLAMLLLVGFGAAALVPFTQQSQVLSAGGIVLAALFAALATLAWVRRAPGAQGLDARTAAALLAALGCLLFAGIAQWATRGIDRMYFAAAALLLLVAGLLLVRRYARLVQDAPWVGYPIMALTVLLLFLAHPLALSPELPLSERMVLAALRSGEWLLAAMLVTWAVLVSVQSAALLQSWRLSRRHAADAAIVATLTTARLGTVASTALFAALSLVLWSVLITLAGLALGDTPGYDPRLFGAGYPSAANFLEAQVKSVGTLFTLLMVATALLALVALCALAPGLRDELAPRANRRGERLDAAAPLGSERLGRWWSWARRALLGRVAGAVPVLALAGAALYLLFLLQRFGLHGTLGTGEGSESLVAVGKWLAGGAVTLTALGARFTQTFGRMRVVLDAVLDVDNYLRDPADGRSPRASIFSRAAALLAELRARGYERIVIVAHSQGTVIVTDLLHWLRSRGRLEALLADEHDERALALVTVGSPLRDLYAARFPLLYRWMQPMPARFDDADARPDPAALGLAAWTSAYRSGDYVGRAIWRDDDDPTVFMPVEIRDSVLQTARSGCRSEFCLGHGAHTHYFADDALPLAVEIDRLVVATLPVRGGR